MLFILLPQANIDFASLIIIYPKTMAHSIVDHPLISLPIGIHYYRLPLSFVFNPLAGIALPVSRISALALLLSLSPTALILRAIGIKHGALSMRDSCLPFSIIDTPIIKTHLPHSAFFPILPIPLVAYPQSVVLIHTLSFLFIPHPIPTVLIPIMV